MERWPELVFTTPSTIALEAVAKGVPTCVLNCWSLDVNFPNDFTWRPATEPLSGAIDRISALADQAAVVDVFGSEQLDDILQSVQQTANKPDLRNMAKRVKFSLRNIVGSFS
jgi:hypothetical protein